MTWVRVGKGRLYVVYSTDDVFHVPHPSRDMFLSPPESSPDETVVS